MDGEWMDGRDQANDGTKDDLCVQVLRPNQPNGVMSSMVTKDGCTEAKLNVKFCFEISYTYD